MEATRVFDVEAVQKLLGGTDAQIDRAVVLIDEHLRERLCGWLRKRFPGLSPDDLANAWAETLLGVLRAARRCRFDSSRGLFPWLCKIANARATDCTRRKTTREETLAAFGQELRGTMTGQRWPGLSQPEQREIMQLIRDAIDLLPGQQHKVLQVFVDNYPEAQNMEALQKAVSEATGREETLASVKRALQEGRQKMRAFLRRKGYDLGKRGDP